MKVAGQERRPDWPKVGPSIIIATALIVAIRTAKWSAKSSNANVSDVDIEMDQEVTFAARTSIRIRRASQEACKPFPADNSLHI